MSFRPGWVLLVVVVVFLGPVAPMGTAAPAEPIPATDGADVDAGSTFTTHDNLNDEINDVVDETEDEIDDTTDEVEDEVEDAEDEVDDATDEVEDEVEDTTDEVENEVEDTEDDVDDTTDDVEDEVEDAEDEVDDTTDDVEDEVEDTEDEIDDTTDDVEDEVKDTEDEIDDTTDDVDDEVEDTEDEIDDTTDEVEDEVEDTEGDGEDEEETSNGESSETPEAGDDDGDRSDSGDDWEKESGDSVNDDSIKGDLGETVNGTIDELDNATEEIEYEDTPGAAGIDDELGEANETVGAIQNETDTGGGAVADAGGDTGEGLDNITPATRDLAAADGADARSKIEETTDGVEREIQNRAAPLPVAIDADIGEPVDEVNGSIGDLVDVVDSTTAEVEETLDSTVETIGDVTPVLESTVSHLDETVQESTGIQLLSDADPSATETEHPGSTIHDDRIDEKSVGVNTPVGPPRGAGMSEDTSQSRSTDVNEVSIGDTSFSFDTARNAALGATIGIVLGQFVMSIWGSVAGVTSGSMLIVGRAPAMQPVGRLFSLPERFIGTILRYSRYDDSDPLDHEDRRLIYESIVDNPGLYLSEVPTETDVGLSTARHHLRILTEENLIETWKYKGKRRYIPVGQDDAEVTAALADPTTKRLLETLSVIGPAPNSKLAEAMDRDPGTISHHLTTLEAEGLIERTKHGRSVTNRLTPEVRQVLDRRHERAGTEEIPNNAVVSDD